MKNKYMIRQSNNKDIKELDTINKIADYKQKYEELLKKHKKFENMMQRFKYRVCECGEFFDPDQYGRDCYILCTVCNESMSCWKRECWNKFFSCPDDDASASAFICNICCDLNHICEYHTKPKHCEYLINGYCSECLKNNISNFIWTSDLIKIIETYLI